MLLYEEAALTIDSFQLFVPDHGDRAMRPTWVEFPKKSIPRKMTIKKMRASKPRLALTPLSQVSHHSTNGASYYKPEAPASPSQTPHHTASHAHHPKLDLRFWIEECFAAIPKKTPWRKYMEGQGKPL